MVFWPFGVISDGRLPRALQPSVFEFHVRRGRKIGYFAVFSALVLGTVLLSDRPWSASPGFLSLILHFAALSLVTTYYSVFCMRMMF